MQESKLFCKGRKSTVPWCNASMRICVKKVGALKRRLHYRAVTSPHFYKWRVVDTVVYQTDYIRGKIRPINMREIEVHYNSDYVPDACAYPDLCDRTFSEQLEKAGVKLPFTMYIERRLLETYKEHNGAYNFYGYIIEDSEESVPRVSWEEAVRSPK